MSSNCSHLITTSGLQLYIHGKSDKICDNEVAYAVQWMLNLLGVSSRLMKTVTIHVKYNSSDNGAASMAFLDDDVKPREFELTISKRRGRFFQLTSLAHELVHIKQYVKGELRQMRNAQTKYRSVKYDDMLMSYWDQPWEIEAYGREIGIVERYKYHIKERKCDFTNMVAFDRKMA